MSDEEKQGSNAAPRLKETVRKYLGKARSNFGSSSLFRCARTLRWAAFGNDPEAALRHVHARHQTKV
jgi:hypothetical protein